MNGQDRIISPTPGSGSRADRMSQPAAAELLRDVATSNGVCIRPVTLKVLDETTGRTDYVDVPCGSTREAVCPACAAKAKALRITQCREGWHRDTEPWDERDPEPIERDLVLVRADVTAERDQSEAAGDTTEAEAAVAALEAVDADLTAGGVRGRLEPTTARRRTRSTRRRDDVPDLPRTASNGSTLGRTFITKGDRVYRPSMFVTVTLPSYGPVHPDGTPRQPRSYDYAAQARDNLHFARLLDRLFQNLRRVAGYDVQYFATIEPQRRGALHAHIAIRGTIPRALVRQLIDATYHQVWWPPTTEIRHDDQHPPVWVPDDPDGLDDTEQTGTAGHYVDPTSGEQLTPFDDAVDDVEDPLHVARFGSVADMRGILTGTPEADRRIGYLCKYLTKSIDAAMDHDTSDDDDSEEVAAPASPSAARRSAHVDRLVEALRYEPCSPTCANWLRYGIEPRNARPRMRAGACRSKAHSRTHLGHAGRRVLVSRRWSGKTLTDHRAERAAFVRAVLLEAADRDVEQQLRHRTGPVDDVDGTEPDSRSVEGCLPPADPSASRRPGWSVSPPDRLDADGQPRRLVWQLAKRTDPVPPLATRLLHAVANRKLWRRQYDEAMARAGLDHDQEVRDVA